MDLDYSVSQPWGTIGMRVQLFQINFVVVIFTQSWLQETNSLPRPSRLSDSSFNAVRLLPCSIGLVISSMKLVEILQSRFSPNLTWFEFFRWTFFPPLIHVPVIFLWFLSRFSLIVCVNTLPKIVTNIVLKIRSRIGAFKHVNMVHIPLQKESHWTRPPIQTQLLAALAPIEILTCIAHQQL